MTRKAQRRRALHDFKREAILEAARAVFARRGLEDASMREIATEAGYTAGALYYYFPDKEHIYAAVLAESLARLGEAVKAAAMAETASRDRARGTLTAFYDFYAARPLDLDLSFYLYRGIGPRGLTPALDRQLNGRLIAVLRVIAGALVATGRLDAAEAEEETVAALCHLCGALLLERSGRLRILNRAGRDLAARYVDAMLASRETTG